MEMHKRLRNLLDNSSTESIRSAPEPSAVVFANTDAPLLFLKTTVELDYDSDGVAMTQRIVG